jgi:hypothetical protein
MQGKNGVPTHPADPPRRRANARPEHGSGANDRPPVGGASRRESGPIRLTVAERSDGETLEAVARRASRPMVTVTTDKWCGSNGWPKIGRSRAPVGRAAGDGARDDDGEGVREVRINTLEGLWTGLRKFRRPFRGVNKVDWTSPWRGSSGATTSSG